jgi:hypothetical protein
VFLSILKKYTNSHINNQKINDPLILIDVDKKNRIEILSQEIFGFIEER